MSAIDRSPLPRTYGLFHSNAHGSIPHSPSISFGRANGGHHNADDDDPFGSDDDEDGEDESRWAESVGGSASAADSISTSSSVTVGHGSQGDAKHDDDGALVGTLPASIVRDTLRPRTLEYLTRGLTSRIYTYALPPAHSARPALAQRLQSYGASDAKLIVKCVDLEDQGRPHDVQKEIDILTRIHEGQPDDRARYIVEILAHAIEEPDAFTTTQRVFFPFYPATLADVLAHDAGVLVEAGSNGSDTGLAARVAVGHTLAQQLFDTLAFLHERGIVHRDIKPGNVLLTRAAGEVDLVGGQIGHDALSAAAAAAPLQLKLCDFGTAHADASRPKTCSTSTHPYTPPELLFAPDEGYDGPAVDVWEAACVVVEMFTEGYEEEVGGKVGPDEDDDEDDEEDAEEEDNHSVLVPGMRRGQADAGADEGDMSWDSTADASASAPAGDEDADWRSLERDVLSFSEAPWGARAFKYVRPRLFLHRTLFDGSCGDLRLASDIFAFCGLPGADPRGDWAEAEGEWPEAVGFHPPLRRMPFRRGGAPAQPEELWRRAAFLRRAMALESAPCEGGGGSGGKCGGNGVDEATRERAQRVQDAVLACLQLSARRRATAEEVARRLRGEER